MADKDQPEPDTETVVVHGTGIFAPWDYADPGRRPPDLQEPDGLPYPSVRPRNEPRSNPST